MMPMTTGLQDPAFRALFDQSREAILVAEATDPHGIVEVNPSGHAILAYEPGDLTGLPLGKVTSGEQSVDFEGFIQSVLQHGEPQTLTTFLQRADGHQVPAEFSLRPFTENGRTLLLGTFEDISERMRALQDIQLRNIAIANVQSGVTIADARQPDLPLIYVNPGFQKMTGYSAKEAIGRSCRFLQGQDRNQPPLEELRDALRKGEACVVQLRNYRKDGSLFYNELHISPVRNELGELTHFVGIQLDVTDRVRANEVLERSELRYRQLANAVDDLILRRTPEGTIEFASSASNRLLGRAPESLIGDDLSRHVHPEDLPSFSEHSREILHARGPLSISFRLMVKSGKYRWFESRDNLAEETNAEGPVLVVSVLRDITRRKRAEEEIQQALEQEKEINEIKTRFISMVSHEFRTPMTSIQASAALLRKYSDRLAEDKKASHLGNIETSLRRMNRLLDDVLFFSRAEASRVKVECKPVRLDDYFQTITESFEPIHPNRSILFDSRIDGDPVYLLDPHLLDHIFQNLISNAIKYSPPNSTVTCTAQETEERLHIAVRDVGIGIPKIDQEKLFVAFHRAGNVGARSGTGLGLNIALRAVELLGGSLSFESRQGEGSTFHVYLPRESPATKDPT
ncbi:MAG: PAS domain S-box protein [Verrucomicrobia bacterium]|jgi:PAS domain S-box-containing protein|nr:PAS domain S-box protein [Verrucomicrobiota bacterium]